MSTRAILGFLSDRSRTGTPAQRQKGLRPWRISDRGSPTKHYSPPSCNQSADHDLLPGRDRGDLDQDTDGEDEAEEGHGSSSADPVRDVRAHQRAWHQLAVFKLITREDGSPIRVPILSMATMRPSLTWLNE